MRCGRDAATRSGTCRPGKCSGSATGWTERRAPLAGHVACGLATCRKQGEDGLLGLFLGCAGGARKGRWSFLEVNVSVISAGTIEGEKKIIIIMCVVVSW